MNYPRFYKEHLLSHFAYLHDESVSHTQTGPQTLTHPQHERGISELEKIDLLDEFAVYVQRQFGKERVRQLIKDRVHFTKAFIPQS